MSAIDPLYLLTLYAPRSADPDEATVLTPAGGAPHAQPFRVATRSFGRAASFDGTVSSYLIKSNVGRPWPASAASVEAWVRLRAGASYGNGRVIFCYASSSFTNDLALGLNSSGFLYLSVRNTSSTDNAALLGDGLWHHVCATWQASDGKARLYVDGIEVFNNTNTTSDITIGGTVVLGQDQDSVGGGFDATQAWLGEIDEVRVYNRVLSALEVKQHMGGLFPKNDVTCARWGFDLDGTLPETAKITAPMLSHSGLSAFDATLSTDGDFVTGNGFHTDTAVAGAWLMVDLGLGNDRAFRQCRIGAADTPYSGVWDVEFADAAAGPWTKVAVGFAPNVKGVNVTPLWAPVDPHRYWRILLTNTPGSGAWLTELEFWSFGGAGGVGHDSSGNWNHLTPFGIATTEDTPLHFFPYLAMPSGRSGRINPLDRKVGVGEWTFELNDQRLTADVPGPQRWLTAFSGSAFGRPRLSGLRFYCAESLDAGLSLAPWNVGRLGSVVLGAAGATLAARDAINDAKMPVFVSPNQFGSITYVARQAVCPIGIIGSDFGTMKQVVPLPATTRQVTVNGVAQLTSTFMQVVLDVNARQRAENLVTRQLVEASAPNDYIFVLSTVYGGAGSDGSIPNFSGPLRARVKHLSGVSSGLTADYKAAGLQFIPGPNGKARLGAFAISPVDVGDLNYLALPATAVSVEITLWVDAPISKDNPLLINDVHFATLLQDMCDGKFGYVWRSPETLPPGRSYGDVKRTVPLANGAAFAADLTFPKQRFVVTSSDELISWAEKSMLKPLNVALVSDESGRLVIVDLRLPSSVSNLPTFLDADLHGGPQDDVEFDESNVISRVNFTRYSDQPVRLLDLELASEHFPQLPPGTVESFKHPLYETDAGASDVGDRAYEVDAPGFRSMEGEEMEGQSRAVFLEQKLREMANQWRRPLGWGLLTYPVRARRSGNPLASGGLAVVKFSHVPDPTTNVRGGPRLVRAIEVSPSGPSRYLRLLDLGDSTIADAPSLAQPAQETNNTYTGATSALTLNAASEPAEVRYAVTDTGVGSVPGMTSSLWVTAGRFTAAVTVIVRKLAPSKRVWFQCRTLPDHLHGKQPSPWVNAGGTGRVDTASLPAPSSPTASLQTARSFRVSWTNGAADLAVELLIAAPTSDPRVVVARLMPGSTLYDFPGDTGLVLSPSTTYRVGVRHVMANRGMWSGVSAEVTVDAVTTSSEPFIQPPIRPWKFI